MDFYTAVLRKSAGYWVALCLENGLVGQGINQEAAIKQLNEAMSTTGYAYASFLEVYKIETDIYCSSVTIEELYEFLAVENTKSI
ncbi:type II toxin-antitoxin system HicB family antitoxin [Nostoc sp. TCL240-02]|uniref:type II toxin-antitoxin system HicB family antitoxin n=1 Tax=Nostoc sp. TCL240-02 TaxID=2572090 RepID=UPI00157FA1A2|nr:type II toxin-antitoxin system HicB family antitoxin [Nostoc sp. TCL240-02]QKQ74897.1 type II toxin-antitoxin system HicB family antitoxin [Nostoc sp. TCL240-02]